MRKIAIVAVMGVCLSGCSYIKGFMDWADNTFPTYDKVYGDKKTEVLAPPPAPARPNIRTSADAPQPEAVKPAPQAGTGKDPTPVLMNPPQLKKRSRNGY